MMRYIVVALCGALSATACTSGRSEAPDQASAVVAALVAEGAAYQPPTEGVYFGDLLDRVGWSGTPERKCVRAEADGNLRSGEFFIGTRLTQLRVGKEGKVWWVPVQQLPEMMQLLVRGFSVESPEDSLRFVNHDWTLLTNYPKKFEDRPYDGMFPGGLTLPTPGPWAIVGTSGPNWGCFILEATE